MAPRVERKLAAILAADVVGYSRLVGNDEAGTIARLKALRKGFIEPLITDYRGRLVKLMGDGALVEFASAVDAVECAVAIQKSIAEREAATPEDQRIAFRIGINVGDIIVEEGDILGDGVNVAARLESLAEPGGICIADNVWSQVKAKLGLPFEPTGEHKVKNIAEPVTVYRVDLARMGRPGVRTRRRSGRLAVRTALAAGVAFLVVAAGTVAWLRPWSPGVASVEDMAFPLPDKPSIAVLPFDNMSGDEKQDVFIDAISDNVINELSHFNELFVIARDSVLSYKGKPTQVQRIAEDLGVQYVLKGSVQRSGDAMRVNVQLIDALTGQNVWAEHYDRNASDVFAVQDEVAQAIVARLGGYQGKLAEVATKRAMHKRATNLSAYETFLLGIKHQFTFTKEDNLIARDLYEKAISLDSEFARAYVGLAFTYYGDVFFGWGDDSKQSLELGFQAARKALALDDSDAEAHWVNADLHLLAREHEQARAGFERARALNPNNADVLADSAYLMYLLGTPDEAIESARRAIRLNPQNPGWYNWNLGAALYLAHRYEEAVAIFMSAKVLSPMYRLYLAASYAQSGQLEEAHAQVAGALKADPDVTVEGVSDLEPFIRPSDREHFRDGMRKAGLPLCATEAHLAKYPQMMRLEECEGQRAKS